MVLEAAPYLADVADGPDTGAAYWTTAADGVRVRVGAWPMEGAQGTLLLMPGRTEFIEKYANTAGELALRNYAMMAIDWRGQGLADRLLPDRRVGHVHSFPDYQHDVAAMIAVAEALEMPRPWHVLGHSMGGAIALRAVIDGLDVQSATFTGPMWGILIAPGMRQLAWGLYYASGWTGQDHRLPPTTSIENYVATSEFADNMLTTDRPMWDLMKRQISTYPDLALGGPSLRWLGEALQECRYLMRAPAPAIPAMTFVGERESIVDREKMRARMANWPNGTFQIVPDAQHEVLMEGPATRTLILEQMLDLFARGEAQANMARAG
ncbi:alpha/beta hydrolase [Aestuariivita sp.]|jgi:lysophospholipase|uniref:alpha/beta fold hydrolase n=1 Tax=Aestuariivita sp. TaxID=1872407 RepID=UPI00216B795C|nr:alpha/beta hydrolase [Aestuariivita sp.]MCE8009799.1 alpha/beta hydrolase [Aestuariivita sp.]|eukprot:TRINITY_DN1475_c1_g1_i1.p2 TRINITY_DN1475_c1_g1~~TRINITY_DN1475_c1_g1_i1.p2  ORF type:complete len:323 (+),score=-26.63 TRINITY_DN1475_c1_g1_i1:374-1342(+)